jgi:competence protein ComEC
MSPRMAPVAPVTPGVAAFCIGALWLQTCATLPPQPLLVVLGGIAGLCALASHRARTACARSRGTIIVASVAVAACTGTTGFGYAAWRAEQRLADALPAALEGVDLRVVGVVDELPQPVERGVRFAFAVEATDPPGTPVPRRLSLGWYAPTAEDAIVPVVHAGERWRFTVRLKRPHGTVNPAGFDLEAWLLERNFRATGVVSAPQTAVRVDAFAGRFTDHVERARERVRARIVAALPGERYAGVIVGLTIGDQRAIGDAQWLVFNRTGVGHLISISGLHVTAFATLAGAVALALARRSFTLTQRLPARKVAVAIGAGLASAYVLLAGAEVPAVRTLAMLVVAAIGLWLDRPGTASSVWLWALAVVLLIDPWAGFAPGFWLSFGAVGLLLYIGSGRLDEPRADAWPARVLARLRAACATQWAITIGLVPATLALFQQVSVVSALANAVAIPVVTALVVPVCLAGLVVPLDLPWIVAHGVLRVLMHVLETLAAWPVATWASHAPSTPVLALALAGIALAMTPRGMPGRALGLACLLPLALVLPPRPAWGTARLLVVDVGQGLAVVVETAAHTLLFDSGPRSSETNDAGARLLVPLLRAMGVRRLDALVVSHSDADHAGGARSILDAVPVATLWSSLAVDHPVVQRALATGTAWRCAPGLAWTWDDVRFTLLHPPLASYGDAALKPNDRSCVLRIEADGRVALLPGDVEARSESLLLDAGPDALRADVLLVPHHGSRTSSTPAFIDAVAPALAIVPAGYRNRFGHPRADVIARYVSRGIGIARTDRDGAVTVALGGSGTLAWTGERARRARYWRDGATD